MKDFCFNLLTSFANNYGTFEAILFWLAMFPLMGGLMVIIVIVLFAIANDSSMNRIIGIIAGILACPLPFIYLWFSYEWFIAFFRNA